MKIMHLWTCLAVAALAASSSPAQNRPGASGSEAKFADRQGDRPTGSAGVDRWRLGEERGIVWDVAADRRLPHDDHLEMSGQKVSVILHYGVDAGRNLELQREVIWPMLRTKPRDVRGYLRRTYGPEVQPQFRADGRLVSPGPVARITFDGRLVIQHQPEGSLEVCRTLFPSTRGSLVVEEWTVRNAGAGPVTLDFQPLDHRETDHGVYGQYAIRVALIAPRRLTLEPKKTVTLGLVFSACRTDQPAADPQLDREHQARARFIDGIRQSLSLETPDGVLNRAFDLAKLRCAESIFDTAMGLVPSPGGGRFYGGIWADDQAEYCGPFFPFLGDPVANLAALNTYRIFAKAMSKEYATLPSSFEVEGEMPYRRFGDRGDAAMIALGASRFALARGDRGIARELFPAVEWCLEYCRRKTNRDGVVESDTDELEGRFPTGKANLSTSGLAYGGLRAAADLARVLGESTAAAQYDHRAAALAAAIESYFGATIDGFAAYRYYAGNTTLRAWICVPLTVGITQRAEGTVAALFSPRLWTADGLATEAGNKIFWDRSTLYALRGVFAAGQTETGLRYLGTYIRRRLLGEHVPYPVEAWPEGDQAHLAAESALFCRVVTEGLFGIRPCSLRSFYCNPRLPAAWPGMALRQVKAFGRSFDLEVRRAGREVVVTVHVDGKTLVCLPNTEITLPGL